VDIISPGNKVRPKETLHVFPCTARGTAYAVTINFGVFAVWTAFAVSIIIIIIIIIRIIIIIINV
jgi:hypothetical protein